MVGTIDVYISYKTKEPDSYSNNGQYSNPKKIEITGSKKDRNTGKIYFNEEWLYISILSRTMNIRIRVHPKFYINPNSFSWSDIQEKIALEKAL